jgi:hypothetical protein
VPPADQPDILAASHPSDHNTVAVLGLPSNTTAKAVRENKALRRREREASRVRKGEMTQEEFDRNAGHAAPFLIPVPLTPPAPAPVTPLGQVICADGWPLGSFAGCVAVCLISVLFLSSFGVVTCAHSLRQDSGAACFTGCMELDERNAGYWMQ